MKRTVLVSLCGLLFILLAACSGKKQDQSSSSQTTPAVQNAPAPTAAAQFKKYDIKSGIATFERVMSAGTMKLTNKVVVTFDDYGNKECKDEYVGDVLKTSNFTDGVKLYVTMYDKKTTFRRGDAFRGTEYRIAWDEISDADKKSGVAKQVSGLQIAGKNCDGYVVTHDKDKTTYAGWGHVCLLLDSETGTTHMIQKAVKFEENPVIDPSKFAAPAGFEIKDSPF